MDELQVRERQSLMQVVVADAVTEMHAEPELAVELVGGQLDVERVVAFETRDEISVDSPGVLERRVPGREGAFLLWCLRLLGRRGRTCVQSGAPFKREEEKHCSEGARCDGHT